MSSGTLLKALAAMIASLPMILMSADCSAQGEQVLAEVGAMGRQAVVRPDFANGDYTNWVELASEGNFRGFAISVFGTALVLDGNVIREYTSAGAVKPPGGGFPYNCTEATFNVPKPGNKVVVDSLATCDTFTPLNDGTLRIAGPTKGGAYVVIAYNPKSQATTLKVNGAPSISDMDGDQFADSDTRRNAGYWAVGDGKKVIFFPLVAEQNFQVVATLNGMRIDSITPFGINQVVVALDTGELLAVNTTNGTTDSFATLPTGAACGLARRDPQKFTVRGDPSGTLFVGNRGCHDISIFNDQLLLTATGDELVSNPFGLDNPAFLPDSLDWQSGQGGDFADCDAASMSEAEGDDECTFGAKEEQAVWWNIQNVGSDTSYRLFQFIDLVDCRWSTEGISEAVPCPVINCDEFDDGMCVDPGAEKQVLDLAQLLIRADQSGAFKEVAFGDGPVPLMAIPDYMRGEKCYPTLANGGLCDDGTANNNGYRFHTFFAVTDAVFTGNFFVDYQINEFREGSSDPCDIPSPGSEISEINETANLIVYNSDSFGTVDRGLPEGTSGGVIINDGCNGRGSAIKWSAQSIGLELYDDRDRAYVDQAARMMGELKQAKSELLCDVFPDPDTFLLLGPLLDPAGPDCANIQAELDQMEQKQETCFTSLFKPLTGGSVPNCSAFFTKAQNLQDVLNAAAWPIPDPQDLDPMFRANYEGEFRSRLAALVFFMQSYVLNGPADGLDPN
jgi:hypothetical protein